MLNLKIFEEIDSTHLAEYGYSKSGLVHIWSNYKGTALCGRPISNKVKIEEVKDKILCRSCAKSNKARYILFDLLPFIYTYVLIKGWVNR